MKKYAISLWSSKEGSAHSCETFRYEGSIDTAVSNIMALGSHGEWVHVAVARLHKLKDSLIPEPPECHWDLDFEQAFEILKNSRFPQMAVNLMRLEV